MHDCKEIEARVEYIVSSLRVAAWEIKSNNVQKALTALVTTLANVDPEALEEDTAAMREGK